MLTFGSLFSGIGGFDLGLERAGLSASWQVEICPFAREVLSEHWPAVRRHDDIRTFPDHPSGDWAVDLIAGGFPCQDVSMAGRKEGIDGERSGLWSEFARVLGVLRPRYAIIENVADLVKRGLDRVLSDLAYLGYDAEWSCVPASRIGAPHRRNRIFIVAYTDGVRQSSHLSGNRLFSEELFSQETHRPAWFSHSRRDARGRLWATPECGIHRVADGFPTGLDEARMRGLGNSIIPAHAEYLGLIVRGLETQRRSQIK